MSTPEEPSYFEVGKKMVIEAEDALLDIFGIEHEDHANSTSTEKPKEKAPTKPVVVSILETATMISDAANDAADDVAEVIVDVKKRVVEAEDSVLDVFGIEHEDHENSTTKKEPKEKAPTKPVVVSILETATIMSDAANDAVESIVEAFSPHEISTTEKLKAFIPHHKSDFEVCAEEFNAGTADLPLKVDSAKESAVPVPPHIKSAFEVCAEPLHVPEK